MRALFLLGRAMFGGFFVYNGIDHFKHQQMLSQYAAQKGTPMPDVAVQVSGAMLIAAGASIVLGLKPRQGLATLVACVVPMTIQIHRFWEAKEPQTRANELVNFTKNMALVGAALTMMEIRVPWRASVDMARREEEMYVRLGGRDLRALPV